MLSFLKDMNKKEKWEYILPAILLSLVTSFTLFIYAPLSLYFSNKNEFWFDFFDIISVLGALFGISSLVFLLLYFVAFFIHKNLYYIVTAIGFIVYISLIIQGNFQTGYIPQIDGASIDWKSLAIHRISSILLWVVVTVVVVAIFRLLKFKGLKTVINVIMTAFFVVFFIITIFLGIQNDGFSRKNNLCITSNNISNYSSEKNFIVFMVDATDASEARGYIDEAALKDFTFYDNMAGLYPFTNHSLPVFIGADPYYCEEDFDEYVANAYRDSYLFSRLQSCNYELQMYETLLPTYENSITRFSNVEDVSIEFDSFSDAMIVQLKMIGLRYAPFDLKRFCEIKPSDISVNQTTGRADISVFSSNNQSFLSFLDVNPTIDDNCIFKFIHVDGAHYPYIYDEKMNVIDESEGSYANNVHATMNMITEYIDYLKANGLYDNSVIIICADHGCSEDRSPYVRSNPLFLVKGFDESHSQMIYNSAPVSFVDLSVAYERLLNGMSSEDIFDWSEGDARERQYFVYNSSLVDGEIVSTNDIEYEYLITGHAGDFESITSTGKMYFYKNVSLQYVFDVLYSLTKNYGYAIILLTILLKVILIPMNIWVQNNSIKMIKMQIPINNIKINHFGDKETISNEIAKLYKKEKYKAWLSTIPMVIQLAIMMVLLNLIKQMALANVQMTFGMLDLALKSKVYGPEIAQMAGFLAGGSSLLFCVCQDKVNVLQKEQSKYGNWLVTAFSVGLSVYLSLSVPLGVILYWVVSNLFSTVWVIVVNIIINPNKYIDYEKLNESKFKLKELESIGGKKSFFNADTKREREDYKRFFSIKNKHLVFYSESNGFYKYFKGFIEEILAHSDMPIHYITSDPNDNIFQIALSETRIKPYYIGEKKLIVLMMKMDADVVVMTMPDLDNYHIKRSYVRKDVEYILVQHGMGSNNLALRKGSMDHYDTVFCCGKRQKDEIIATENVFCLPRKNLIDVGYPLLDEMINSYKEIEHVENSRKKILIAPSWQEDNIIDNCLDKILDSIQDENFDIIVRPHPQHVKHNPKLFEHYKKMYQNKENILIQTDFSTNISVLEADILITDWSGIAWEYSFVTNKPTLFINTKMKVMNPDYQKIDIVPLNIEVRDVIGKSINVEETYRTKEIISQLLNDKDHYKNAITTVRNENAYNLGHSAYVGGRYIIEAVMKKVERRKLQ